MTNAIQDAAQVIRREYPTLNVGKYVTYDARNALIYLAEACGLTHSDASDTDLLSVYRVALKDAGAAIRTANKIQTRLDPASDPLTPYTPPSAPSRPADPVAPPTEPLAAVFDLTPIWNVTDDLDGRIAALAEELLGVRDGVFSDVSARLDALAHSAAVEALKALTPARLEVSVNAAPITSLGLVHRDTHKVIRALASGVNVYLHGPAGSGKTTVGQKCAEAFALPFYFAAKVESEYQLIGFTDAKGGTVRTPFREAYEGGGVFLFDEMDASSPAAVVALNAALANGVCPFPDGIVKRHKDFHVIGAGNTKLTGASRAYAGRNKLDAASIDRFAFIEFGYDNDLERALATDADWCTYVQTVRQRVADRGLDHLVTPRATYDGCKLLAQGFPFSEVCDMVIFKGLDADTIAQINKKL